MNTIIISCVINFKFLKQNFCVSKLIMQACWPHTQHFVSVNIGLK